MHAGTMFHQLSGYPGCLQARPPAQEGMQAKEGGDDPLLGHEGPKRRPQLSPVVLRLRRREQRGITIGRTRVPTFLLSPKRPWPGSQQQRNPSLKVSVTHPGDPELPLFDRGCRPQVFGSMVDIRSHLAEKGQPTRILRPDQLSSQSCCRSQLPKRLHGSSQPREPVNPGRVSSSPLPMPSRAKTLTTVRARILRSSQKEQFSTYQRSRANFSSHSRVLRPLIWAQPVIPGLTSWRRICSSL